jgi:hypothetical protein
MRRRMDRRPDTGHESQNTTEQRRGRGDGAVNVRSFHQGTNDAEMLQGGVCGAHATRTLRDKAKAASINFVPQSEFTGTS